MTGVLLARRLLDRDRVSDVLMRHMGWSWRSLTLSRTGELAATMSESFSRSRRSWAQ